MTPPVQQAYLKRTLNLIYTSDNEPGYFRKKWGRGFRYLDEKNNALACKKTLDRIKDLVIPPIWEGVWICKKDNGHLQSTGRDLKKRKQYIYHVDWTAYRQSQKFSKLLEFSRALPDLRKTVDKNLQKKKWTREKVLSLAIKIMDEQHIRIGNQQYAEKNGTYGLTTLRRKHIEMEKGELTFSYKAKSNKYRNVQITDSKLAKLIQQCSELPGYKVLCYQGKDGKSNSIDSSEVNEFIQENMGEEFSSKDFRTWGGTALAVKFYKEAVAEVKKNTRKKLEPTLVKKVAKELGNTMAVCRKYYIHPCILELVKAEKLDAEDFPKDTKWLDGYERATQRILKKNCKE